MSARLTDLSRPTNQTLRSATSTKRSTGDPLVAALVRYVDALDCRYPDGPEQLCREGLAARANMRRMRIIKPGSER